MSKNAIEGLKPQSLWQRFFELTQVPRPSKKEEKVIEYLINLAKELKLNYKKDKVGNVLISIPATKGYENSLTIVLQSHVDMVCEKNKETNFDFDNDPIKLLREGEWIKADGTTLGSDNGIGAAAALAVLTDSEITHGPIECLFTIDEETGLTGANNLEPGFVTGKTLLNLDTEEDGAFYIGCSGGIDTQGEFDSELVKIEENMTAFNLQVSGLKGGHSGIDIHLGKGNAIKFLGRTLRKLESLEYHLAFIEGGSKRNAIAREAEATILVKNSDVQNLEKIVTEFESLIKDEFKTVEPQLKIKLQKADKKPEQRFSDELKSKLINSILAIPHGVINMSPDIPDLVETSTNLATISNVNGKIILGTSQRSSVESAKKYVQQSVVSVFNLANVKVMAGDGYPGWKPSLDSKILTTAKDIYKKLYNDEPVLKAVHAGLECGILGEKYPGMDMISFGPTILGAHSPDEKVHIPSVEKFYDLLSAILEELAKQKK